MLILSRKQGESLLIGDHITVTILSVRPGCIRIGIDAPDDVAILREEIVQYGNEHSTQNAPASDSC